MLVSLDQISKEKYDIFGQFAKDSDKTEIHMG